MLLLPLTIALLSAPPVEASPGVSVTIYSSADPAGFDPQQFIAQQKLGGNPAFAWQVPGFGVIKEVRRVAVKEGQQAMRFTDVAAFIDPTTVSFTDLTDPRTTVLEQNFEFDLVSPDKLLEKFIDQPIHLVRYAADVRQDFEGVLLSASGGQIILKRGDGLTMLPMQGLQIDLASLPGGLNTRPTLVWKLAGGSAGDHTVRTTYQTAGITWKADYNLVLYGDETSADVAAWVTLLNVSGATYKEAQLKLVAGDVQRIQPKHPAPAGGRGGVRMGEMLAMDAGFEEKSFFEYHLYTLPRKTDILSNATQQITLFPTATAVPVEKVLIYDTAPEFIGWGYANEPYGDRELGATTAGKIDVIVRLVNDEKSKMGRPLPKGKVRVYKQDDADGTLEFIGEDLIDHTPRNEKVRVKVGQSFDVIGERKQTEFTMDSVRRTMSESFRIEVRNRKTVAQKVVVRERLYRWSTWEITKKSAEFVKQDARTIEWEVDVPADGTSVIEYTAKYAW